MFRNLTILVCLFLVMGSANADWGNNYSEISASDVPQDIVITLKSNPMSNAEEACLAVTFARSLSGNPNANVTLFVTLDGVSLADEDVAGSRRFKCNTPWGEISLIENLEEFLVGNENNMVVCPLCWNERYHEEKPDYGVLPGYNAPGNAIGAMMFNADKILDF